MRPCNGARSANACWQYPLSDIVLEAHLWLPRTCHKLIFLLHEARPGSTGEAAKPHWEEAYHALFGLKQMSIQELGAGTKCFRRAVMAFDQGIFTSGILTPEKNPDVRRLLSRFRSWAYERLQLEHVCENRHLSVINRSMWRTLVNGDRIASMARSLGWQAQVSPRGS